MSPVASPAIALPALVGAAFGASPFADAFYDVSAWGPIGLGSLVGLVAAAVAAGVRRDALALVVFGSLVGLWAWALVSQTWAEADDRALLEANRLFCYVSILGLLLVLVRDARTARAALLGVAAGGLAVVLYIVARGITGDGSEMFLAGRLHDPLVYANGQGGHLVLVFLVLAAAAERLRPPALAAGAAAMASLAVAPLVLTQSRGPVIALAVALIVLFALVPGRRRRVGLLLAIAVAMAPGMGRLVDVYPAAESSEIRSALLIAVVGSLVAGALWWALLTLEGQIGSQRFQRAATAIVAVVVGVVVVATAGIGPRVADEVREQARAFVNRGGGTASTRLLSGSGQRHDYWRVALDGFRSEPLRGHGAGAFPQLWFAEREAIQDVRQPHSLALQTLTELGAIGLVLLLAAVAAAAAALVLRARDDRFVALAAGGIVVAWFTHANIDWVHLMPGLAGTALLATAALLAPASRFLRVTRRGSAALAVAGAVLAYGAVNLYSELSRANAYSDARAAMPEDPATALAATARALRLRDDDRRVLYLRAAAYAAQGDYIRAKAVLERAKGLAPGDYVGWLLLGDLESRRGNRKAATRAYREASRLNPRDAELAELARSARPEAAP